MTAALASRTAPPAQSRPPMPTVSDGSGRSATSWEASSAPSAVEYTLDVALPVGESAVADGADPPGNAIAEFTKLLLTQWMAAFVTYEALAATIDRKGRYLPTLGL